MSKRRDKALMKLEGMLARLEPGSGTRLPPERALCDSLGVSRSALREALEVMEADGRIWRRVGMGTYYSGPPSHGTDRIVRLSAVTSPFEIMEARLMIEPNLASLAAVKATALEIDRMRKCLEKSAKAQDEETHEKWDRTLHLMIASSTKNQVLIAVYEALNSVRDLAGWGELGEKAFTPAHIVGYYDQHRAIIDAIAERASERAGRAMREHLEAIERKILATGLMDMEEYDS